MNTGYDVSEAHTFIVDRTVHIRTVKTFESRPSETLIGCGSLNPVITRMLWQLPKRLDLDVHERKTVHWIIKCQRDVDCVSFEVFTTVTMKNAVFWDITPCGSFTSSCHPDDGGTKFLRNIVSYKIHTA
jgi:hypothetical protein